MSCRRQRSNPKIARRCIAPAGGAGPPPLPASKIFVRSWGSSVPEARGQGGPDAGPMAGPPVAGTGGRRRGGAVARGHSRSVVNDAARVPRGSLRAAAVVVVLSDITFCRTGATLAGKVCIVGPKDLFSPHDLQAKVFANYRTLPRASLLSPQADASWLPDARQMRQTRTWQLQTPSNKSHLATADAATGFQVARHEPRSSSGTTSGPESGNT